MMDTDDVNTEGWQKCLREAEEGSVPFDIHTAASLGDLEVVQYYLSRDPTLCCRSHIFDASSIAVWNPLLRAAWNGHVETTAALVEAAKKVGIDPGAGSADLTGRTALMVAAYHGYEDVVKLFDGVNAPMERDNKGRTALHHAVLGSNERVVQILLKAGSDPKALDNGGITPKRLAELYERTSIAKILSMACPSTPPTPLLNAGLEGGKALKMLLTSLNLDKYWPKFDELGIDLAQFLALDEEDLRNIGITLFGPRRKMVLEIEKLRSEGFRCESVGSSHV